MASISLVAVFAPLAEREAKKDAKYGTGPKRVLAASIPSHPHIHP